MKPGMQFAFLLMSGVAVFTLASIAAAIEHLARALRDRERDGR